MVHSMKVPEQALKSLLGPAVAFLEERHLLSCPSRLHCRPFHPGLLLPSHQEARSSLLHDQHQHIEGS